MATIIVGTNSYVTEAELQTWADDTGRDLTGSDLSVLLINAKYYIESYSYTGVKYDETQSLKFPRYYPPKAKPETSPDVPNNIKEAQYNAAYLVHTGVDFFAPVGRAVKREKVDVLEVEYMDNASETTRYPSVYTYLKDYIAASNNGFQFSVTRT